MTHAKPYGTISPHVLLPSWVLRHLHPSAPMESPWIWHGLLALTILVIGALIYRATRRRRKQLIQRPLRRWAGRSIGAAGVLVLVVLTTLAWLNSYVGYVATMASIDNMVTGGPAVPGAVSAAGLRGSANARTSSMVVARIGAPRLRVPPLDAYIYLPPGYTARANTHRRYPVVYLIHGYPGRPADWMVAGGVPETLNGLISTGQIGPMIVVAPNASGGYMHDSECLNQVGGPQIASYLTGPVVHYVDSHFRTISTRAGRAIGGASSGGFCGLNLGLRHRSEFSAILAFEPYGTPGMSVLGPMLHGDLAAYRANSPSFYLSVIRFHRRVAAFLDAGGASRRDVARVRLLAYRLAARGQTVAFRIESGQTHTWKEAAAGLPYGIFFAAHHLTGGLPAHHLLSGPAAHRTTGRRRGPAA